MIYTIYYKTDQFINVKSETIGNFDENYKFTTSDHLPVQITIDVEEYTNNIKNSLEWYPPNITPGEFAIHNSGARCFQIAAIQLMFHVDEYRKTILKEGYFNEKKKDKNLLLHHLYHYFLYLIKNYGKLKNNFSQHLKKKGVKLNELNIYPTDLFECSGRNEDAEEFLQKVFTNIPFNNTKINIIEEANIIIPKNIYNSIDANSEEKKIYTETKLETDLYCDEFKDDGQCFTEDIEGRIKFDKNSKYYKKLLQYNSNFVMRFHFNSTELSNHFISYEINEEDYKIDNNKYKNQIIKEIKNHTNYIICIHMARFFYDKKEKKLGKINEPFTIQEVIKNNNDNYKLKGFIEHIGEYMDYGHYVSHIKINKKWYYFDDRTVEQKDPTLEDNESVYILIYEKDKTISGGYYKKYIKYKQKYINKSIYENYNSDINYYNKYIKYKQKYLLK